MSKLLDKRDFLRLLTSAAVAAPTAIAVSDATRQTAPAEEKISVYDRVMTTRTIRCGYGVWPPFIIKDPNTGKLSGIFYDYMEALGQTLSLKIDWAEEISSADFPAALKVERIDAMCFSIWPNASRAREADFTMPVYYTAHYAYVRTGDARFDNNLDAIEAFDMKDFIDHYPNEASLGQRQRVALARALMLEPRYLLLDEITSALDVEQIAKILSYLKGLRGKEIGIFIITHLLGFARHAADQVLFMANGEIAEQGGPDILKNPQTERLGQFLSVIAAAS